MADGRADATRSRWLKGTLRVGVVAGVDVGLHYSWFVVFGLFIWIVSDALLPDRYPGWRSAEYWATGVAAVLLLFGSVLVHELAHSIVARKRGSAVEGITLFLLGGMSSLGGEVRAAKDEFVISIVGPLTSAILFALVWSLSLVMADGGRPIDAIVWYLWTVNLLLAAFNLLPAFPMDGGRVLRSVVWGATGSMATATKVASRVGQAFGVVLAALGVIAIVTGGLVGALWIGLGWFIFSAASASLRGLRESLELERVQDGSAG